MHSDSFLLRSYQQYLWGWYIALIIMIAYEQLHSSPSLIQTAAPIQISESSANVSDSWNVQRFLLLMHIMIAVKVLQICKGSDLD